MTRFLFGLLRVDFAPGFEQFDHGAADDFRVAAFGQCNTGGQTGYVARD